MYPIRKHAMHASQSADWLGLHSRDLSTPPERSNKQMIVWLACFRERHLLISYVVPSMNRPDENPTCHCLSVYAVHNLEMKSLSLV